jgi:hypothetical protein
LLAEWYTLIRSSKISRNISLLNSLPYFDLV